MGFGVYYFTFLANDVSTGETKTYQCKVYVNTYARALKVLVFREKPLEEILDAVYIPSSPLKKQKFDIDIGLKHTSNVMEKETSDDEHPPRPYYISSDDEYISSDIEFMRYRTGYISSDNEYVSDNEKDSHYRSYKIDIRKYEGFDLPFFPDFLGKTYGCIIPYYSFDMPHPPRAIRGIKFLKYAIKDFNKKKNKHLELVKVLKLNVQFGFNQYFFTFLAKDISTGETKTYQCKVYDSFISEVGAVVIIFRGKKGAEVDYSMDKPYKFYKFYKY